MSGHAIRLVEIICDYPGCPARFESGDANLNALRRWAHEKGWTSFNGEFGRLDMCPEHSK